MSKPKVYIDACCFIEMACHKVGTHKKEREDDIPFLQQILQGAYVGEIEVYTSILSVAECQCAFDDATKQRILTDEVKKLFRDILTSGQFVILVQDSILVAERGRNLSWVHALHFSGADAIHIASALEMGCDEFITFDGKIRKNAENLEALGLTVRYPKETTCLKKETSKKAHRTAVSNAQPLLTGLEGDAGSGAQETTDNVTKVADTAPEIETKGNGTPQDSTKESSLPSATEPMKEQTADEPVGRGHEKEAITEGQPQANSAAAADGGTDAPPSPTPDPAITGSEQSALGGEKQKLGQQASPPSTEDSVAQSETKPPASDKPAGK